MDIVFFVLGLATLVGGAELLVRGASRLSLSFGISPLVVGLTVVAFGTSAPELAVSVQSAMTDRADIALGNVVGSNICNVLLILGLYLVTAIATLQFAGISDIGLGLGNPRIQENVFAHLAGPVMGPLAIRCRLVCRFMHWWQICLYQRLPRFDM